MAPMARNDRDGDGDGNGNGHFFLFGSGPDIGSSFCICFLLGSARACRSLPSCSVVKTRSCRKIAAVDIRTIFFLDTDTVTRHVTDNGDNR